MGGVLSHRMFLHVLLQACELGCCALLLPKPPLFFPPERFFRVAHDRKSQDSPFLIACTLFSCPNSLHLARLLDFHTALHCVCSC